MEILRLRDLRVVAVRSKGSRKVYEYVVQRRRWIFFWKETYRSLVQSESVRICQRLQQAHDLRRKSRFTR